MGKAIRVYKNKEYIYTTNKMEKRYLVTTWSRDIGSDEHMDFRTKAEAIKECRKYRKTEEYGAVFDKWNKIAYVIFGDVDNPVFVDGVTVVKA